MSKVRRCLEEMVIFVGACTYQGGLHSGGAPQGPQQVAESLCSMGHVLSRRSVLGRGYAYSKDWLPQRMCVWCVWALWVESLEIWAAVSPDQ